MRTIQEIFNAVINNGHYPRTYHFGNSSNYMCTSLTIARECKTISETEEDLGRNEIAKYLEGLCYLSNVEYSPIATTLRESLVLVGVTPDFLTHDQAIAFNLRVYNDWANKPLGEQLLAIRKKLGKE